ncbi:oocyte zinc finger protein XlCOF8.4-like isoform X2 [Xenopus laevis]|uniref:Oocyte zinc finger protein XlCOF8.4-like isoform X2 n=1 Tax=Xenopus laevis TaxID=8355 RepID=A0A8J1MFS1_XENLA|nr:oocyte zinc finger protein XlCOF8.4-like isoform X2 [Xenopus laevis]
MGCNEVTVCGVIPFVLLPDSCTRSSSDSCYRTPSVAMIDMGSHQATERIVSLTLEILSLLTGEDYIVVKKQSKEGTATRRPSTPDGHVRSQSHKPNPPVGSLSPKRIPKRMELAAPEVLLRCDDAAVYLSMDEWEYLKGHKEHYQGAVIEDFHPTSSIGCDIVKPIQLWSERDKEAKLEPQEKIIHPNTCVDTSVVGEIQGDGLQVNASREHVNIVTVMERDQKENLAECQSPERNQEDTKKDQSLEERIHFTVSPKRHQMREPLLIPNPCIEKIQENPCVKIYEFKDDSINFESDVDCLPRTDSYELNKGSSVSEENGPTISALSQQSDAKCQKESGKHYTQTIGPDKEKQFVCSFCGKCFRTHSYITRHIRTHTGEKPFQCPVCSKWFSDKSVLVRHHKSHTGQKPFICSYCEKCFSQRAGLVEHLNLHTGDKPYMCPECGKCFKYRTSLKSHRRIHRGKSVCA